MCGGVLMRRCMLNDDSSSPNKVSQRFLKQIVLPPEYRPHVLSLAHDVKTNGHLGRTKTTFKLLQSFYWPGVYSDVSKYVKSWHNCQISGKAGQHPAKAPLIPTPVMSEPFQKIQIDCVGPLNPTSTGTMYHKEYHDRAEATLSYANLCKAFDHVELKINVQWP